MKRTSKKILALVMTVMMVSFVFVGCGNDDMNDATGGNETSTSTTNGTNQDNMDGNTTDNGVVGDAAEGVGDAVGDVVDGVGDAVGDVVDGVGDATKDITSGGFSSYEDAHDYLIDRLGHEDNQASYEIRNVKKDVVEYQNGQKGYQFEVHDTRDGKDKKVGTFYVDQETGKVYKGDENNKELKEYTFS